MTSIATPQPAMKSSKGKKRLIKGGITLPNIWNNMLNGVLYLSPEKQPVTALINSLSGTYATNYQAMYSGLFMSMVPLLIVYLLFQNRFIRSAMLGAVKG